MSASAFSIGSAASSDSSPASSVVVTCREPQSPRPTFLLQTNLSWHRVQDNVSKMESLASIQPSSATLHNSDAIYEDYDDAMPEPPPRAHTRERPSYEDRSSTVPEDDPFSDHHALLSSRPWVTDDDMRSIKSFDTFHTAVQAVTPNPFGLRRTDSLPTLTPTVRPRRRKAKPVEHEDLLQKSNTRQDYKLRLERAKDEVRLVKSLSPKTSTSPSSSGKKLTNTGQETENQNPIPSLVKSRSFRLCLLVFLLGLSIMSGLAGMIATKKADGVRISKWMTFWLVCSIVLLLLGVLSTIVLFVEKGNTCHAFLEKLGLNEVRTRSDGDLESGRAGGLLYLGVNDRGDTSTLGGGSLSDLRSRNRGRDQTDGASTTGSAKTIIIDTVHYDRIQNPEWKALYSTPDPLRYPRSIRSTTPTIPSKLRQKVEQEEPDLGARRVGPAPAFLRVSGDTGECHVSGRSGLMNYGEEDGFEMVDLSGRSI